MFWSAIVRLLIQGVRFIWGKACVVLKVNLDAVSHSRGNVCNRDAGCMRFLCIPMAEGIGNQLFVFGGGLSL